MRWNTSGWEDIYPYLENTTYGTIPTNIYNDTEDIWRNIPIPNLVHDKYNYDTLTVPKNYDNKKELVSKKEKKDMFNFNNLFDGMFKPVGSGYCKMSMDGKLAIKTSTGYKTFDIDTNRLTNCDNFAFDMDGAFWVVPTFKVEKGDIILVNNKPKCVIEVNDKSIKVFSYEDSTISEVIPEHHVFMGKTYCYGKVFSPFMNMTKADNMNDMMKMMMMSQMFGGNSNSNFNPMMFMMMNGNGSDFFSNMFEGAFDFGTKEDK